MKLMMHILSIQDHHKKTEPPQQINGEIPETMETVVSTQTERVSLYQSWEQPSLHT